MSVKCRVRRERPKDGRSNSVIGRAGASLDSSVIHRHCADTAVYAATRAAGASPSALPLRLAFIANVASFVLPISNPANLVVYGARMPHLAEWLRQFALLSIAASVVAYVAFRLTQRRAPKKEKLEASRPVP